jgi:xanthine dehydrogenase accessory factor
VLADMNLTDAERGRIHTPAGLDLGARTAEEIALSIMAEVVRAIRREGLRAAGEPATGALAAGDVAASEPVQVIDPVCGMTVVIGPDTPHLLVDGEDLWFCSAGCRDRYAA